MAPKPSTTSSTTTKGKPGKGPAAKATPRQPLPLPDRLKRLFTSLCAQIDGGHFTNAIKTCEKILALDPEDVDAKQTKLFLLLQTEQYDAALSLIDGLGNGQDRGFEQAYALYRLQNETEAKEALQSVKDTKGEGDRGAMHLEAQLSYRNGSYAHAVDLYNELLETAEQDSEEYSDVLTNLQAAQKHLEFIESGFRKGVNSLPTATVSSLESTAPPAHPSTSAAAALASAAASSSVPGPAAPPKEKKVRKSRVPAGVTPGVTPPPDPERWLKKSERSTFNQGRRRKGQGGGGATQGAAMVDSPNVATGGGSAGGSQAKKGKKKK